MGRLLSSRKASGLKSPRRLKSAPRPSGVAGFALLELLAFFFEDRLAAELDLVAFERQNLHQDLVALVQLVAHLLDAALRDFGDMQQPVRAGEDFDERAEIDDPHHLA